MYARVWSRARTADFVFLAMTLWGTSAVSFGVELLSPGHAKHRLVLKAILFASFATLTVLGLRSVPRAIRDLMALRADRKLEGVKSATKLLIYGAGARCQLFLRSYKTDIAFRLAPIEVVGLLDDDRNLRKRMVYGFQVLGQGHELAKILTQQRVDKLLITCTLPERALKELIELARARGFAIAEWSVQEQDFTEVALQQSVNA
jgi:FlaA1/EpsC-like NDP-sugar epimerase